MYHIELIGPPGCGKTTISGRLTSARGRYRCLSEKAALRLALRRADHGWAGRAARLLPASFGTAKAGALFNLSPSKAAARAAFLSRHHESLQAFLESRSFAAMGIEERTAVLSWFLELAARYGMIIEHCGDAAVILDEGFLLRSVSLFVSPASAPASESEIARYLEDIPLPDLLIVVESDPATCMARLQRRGPGRSNTRLRMKSADEKTAAAFLKDCRDHVERVVAWVRDRRAGSVAVVRNGPADSIADAVASAAEVVARRLDGSSGRACRSAER